MNHFKASPRSSAHLGLVLLAALIPLTAVSESTDVTVRAPRPSSTAGAHSFSAAISPDARFVLFLGRANNLVTNDSMNLWTDIFLRDRVSRTTTLISVDGSGVGGGGDDSISPAVSADGLSVVFESAAGNLVAGDSNGLSDVFLRDLTTGTNRKISTAPDGSAAQGASENPQISRDGRYVVYESRASNLVTGESTTTREVFIHDRIEQSHRRASAPLVFPGQLFPGDGPAHSISMTPDARQMAYVRSPTNTSSQTTWGEILVWNAESASTHWLSRGIENNEQTGLPASCYNPTISGNGTVVLFKDAPTGGDGPISLYRQVNPPEPGVPAVLIGTNATRHGWASVSHDGRWVAYESTDGVRLWDVQPGTSRLILGNLPEPTRRVCTQPTLSADGRRLVFLVSSNELASLHSFEANLEPPLRRSLLRRPAGEKVSRAAKRDGTDEVEQSKVHGPDSGGALQVAALHDRIFEIPVKSDGTPARIADVSAPLLSEDGGTIIFDSGDDTLVEGDLNQAGDVFAFVFEGAQRDCVSLRAPSRPGLTPAIASSPSPASISADGNVVAVSVGDTGGGDSNRLADLYVRNRATGAQRFLGTTSSGTNRSGYPSLSADGRYVAWLSLPVSIHNLLDSRQDASVWWRDLVLGTEMLVHPKGIVDGPTSGVAISPDGKRVAFAARNLTGWTQLFLYDTRAGTTSLISAAYAYNPFIPMTREGGGDSMDPRFSPDGRWLLFSSKALDLTTNHPGREFASSGRYARDLIAERTHFIGAHFLNASFAISADSRRVVQIEASQNGQRATIVDLETMTTSPVPALDDARALSSSATGRWIAYEVAAAGEYNVFVRDTQSQTTELINVQYGATHAAPSVGSSRPTISHDGRHVVFVSSAHQLVPGDTNRVRDIFVRDRMRGVTLLASINRAGDGSGNGPSIMPILAADGRTLLFQSYASDLVDGDYNETADVFVLRLGGPDGDGDGMDDEWEAAYFGNLSRTGSGDLDGDGKSDVAEYETGTDPTNAGSVIPVMQVTREGGLGTKLLWTAVPGRRYRVQFTDDLSSVSWTYAAEEVTAAGTTATWVDSRTNGAPERYYRVVVETGP